MRPADGIRFMNEFRKAGWIEYDRHQIIVNNRLWKAMAAHTSVQPELGSGEERAT